MTPAPVFVERQPKMSQRRAAGVGNWVPLEVAVAATADAAATETCFDSRP